MIIHSFFLLLFFITGSHAQTLFSENMPFLKARKLALEIGWQPYATQGVGRNGFPRSAAEKKLLDQGFVEISSCSEGETYCNFFYSRKGECLLLESKGEQLKSMQLAYWNVAPCPPKE